MSRLAIIPARGGSKRIPGKNIKPFLGKPIISYSIEAAVSSGLFDTVMVSTEDSRIKEIALEYGAIVPFDRSAENSDDHATTFDVIEEVVSEYVKSGKSFDEICCIYATAPFITPQSIKKALDLLNKGDFDTVFPAIEFNTPIQRAFRRKENGLMELLQPEHLNSRSQDLERCYHDAGQFYWMRYERIKELKALWTDNTGLMVIDEKHGHDIDTEADWKMAELKYQLLAGD